MMHGCRRGNAYARGKTITCGVTVRGRSGSEFVLNAGRLPPNTSVAVNLLTGRPRGSLERLRHRKDDSGKQTAPLRTSRHSYGRGAKGIRARATG